MALFSYLTYFNADDDDDDGDDDDYDNNINSIITVNYGKHVYVFPPVYTW